MYMKNCIECGEENHVAKKSCACGFVFNKRALHGFQEMPVILTPERLRSFGRPVRKKQKQEDVNFVYDKTRRRSKGIHDIKENVKQNMKQKELRSGKKLSGHEKSSNSNKIIENNKETISKSSNDKNKIVEKNNSVVGKDNEKPDKERLVEKSLETIAKNIIKKSATSSSLTKPETKLYPIRNRSSTSKFSSTVKTIETRNTSKNPRILKKQQEKNVNVTFDESLLVTDETDGKVKSSCDKDDDVSSSSANVVESVINSAEKGETKVVTGKSTPEKSKQNRKLEETEKNIKVASSNCNSPRLTNTPFVRLSPSIHELLLEYSEKEIDVVTVKTEEQQCNWRKKLMECNLKANHALASKKATFITNEKKLLKIEIPKGIMKMMKQKAAASAKKKAILTASATKKNTDNSTQKRPIGRPRIHFKDDKPKRPIGRPRIHPRPEDRKKKIKKNSKIQQGRRSDKLERFSKSAAVAELAGDNILSFAGESSGDEEEKLPKKRGRPKGTKDSKPRKLRQDVVRRPQNMNGNFKTPMKGGRSRACFLSPPSLIASAKKERIKNEILEKVEHDRLTKKLKRTKPIIIPPEKRELFSLILDDINRRIISQSFTVR